MLGPVAQESVVDSALLRSIFRPFKPAFLYTTCTQSSERATLLLITSGLLVQELRCVRVLDPIPTKPSCVVSFLDDSGLLTLARTDELRFVNLSSQASQATIRCASAASGPYSCAGSKCARVARPLSRASTMINVRGRGTFSSFV